MNGVQFLCPQCGQEIVASLDAVGSLICCPQCQTLVHVPPPGDDGSSGMASAAVLSEASDPNKRPEAFAVLAGEQIPGPRVARKGGRRDWPMVFLLFLVPYAVLSTGVASWLWWKDHERQDPLEWLIDQQPADGGPKLPKNDYPLLDRQKTPLGKPLRIGDVCEVTPIDVSRSEGGDQAVLTLRLRNLSNELQFNPIPQSFLVPRGYTYLEFGKQRIYGGTLTWTRPGSPPTPFDGVLGPGQEMTARLTTLLRDRDTFRKLADYHGPVLWRLEVRRGLAAVHGKLVSATAVMGVEFDAGALAAEGRAVALGWTK